MCIVGWPSVTSGCHHCICSFYLAKQHHAFVLLVNGNIEHVCISNIVCISIVGRLLLLEAIIMLKHCSIIRIVVVLQVPVIGDEQEAHSSTLMAFFVD